MYKKVGLDVPSSAEQWLIVLECTLTNDQQMKCVRVVQFELLIDRLESPGPIYRSWIQNLRMYHPANDTKYYLNMYIRLNNLIKLI